MSGIALTDSPGKGDGERDPVTSKRRNFELFILGAYGNRLRAWRSVEEWRRNKFAGRVALRMLGQTGCGSCTYDLEPEAVEHEYRRWISLGASSDDVSVSEMAPDDRLIVNGEYHHDPLPDGSFRHFFFSRVKKPMRVALREGGRVASGLCATAILRGSMTDESWNDFEELIFAYPGHVIEVSVYDHCLGDLPGRNALVWEVRRY